MGQRKRWKRGGKREESGSETSPRRIRTCYRPPSFWRGRVAAIVIFRHSPASDAVRADSQGSMGPSLHVALTVPNVVWGSLSALVKPVQGDGRTLLNGGRGAGDACTSFLRHSDNPQVSGGLG
ncbi:hypothetical protein R1flu_025877 [Riccia fluitans]|uniref:Uncharacterized protein n=1 Tax=Riccia fluitans TaxID=41844 RepID=A0ABD1XZE0_9MARC